METKKENSETPSATDAHIQRILAVKKLMKKREEARIANNFVLADSFREKLNEMGVDIQDQKSGVGPSGWKFKDGSSKKIPSGTVLPPPEKSEPKAKRPRQTENSSEPTTQNKKKKIESSGEVAPKVAKKSKTVDKEVDRMRANVQAVIGTDASGKKIEGVLIEDVVIGSGRKCKSGDRIRVNYVGKLKSNNRVFDASKKPFTFKLGRGEVIRGWDVGCADMAIGGKRKLTIPPEKGYGKSGAPPTIPPNATLLFDVTLLEIL